MRQSRRVPVGRVAFLFLGGSADARRRFPFCRIIPETKGLSLEEMDVVFGVVSSEAREAFIRKEERALGATNDVASSGSVGTKV